MQRYSLAALARRSFTGHRSWKPLWRSHPLSERYDIVVVGARRARALRRAYYLARNQGRRNVAVLERGWLGGGNVGRNTVTVRSNYLRDESIPFYVKSVELFEGLSKELNFNLMHSKRGMIDIVQTWPKLRELRRKQLAMDLHGSTYRQIGVEEIRRRIPGVDRRRTGQPVADTCRHGSHRCGGEPA